VDRRLESQVRVVPHRSEIQALYEAIDVLVSPSRTEGISNVILEAMSFERPIVATRVGGTGEIVVHQQTGLLVEPLHPEAWPEELMRLIDEPRLRRAFGVRGRERIERNFSFDRRMRLEEQFYDRALQARRSR
jgi:glycosyltransferase involved in cell wall biosynthesis